MENKKITVAIDATFTTAHITGVSNYIYNLIQAIACVDDYNKYIILVKKNELLKWEKLVINKNFKFIRCNFQSKFFRLFWHLFILDFYLREYGIDILHSPHYILPLRKGPYKTVVTIHDVIFFILPKFYGFLRKCFLQNIVLRSINKANKIITVSDNVKKDIISISGIPKDKIEVILEAHSSYFESIVDKESFEYIKRQYSIPDKFFLSVGELRGRKNILNLIKAYHVFNKKLPQKYKLIIVGKDVEKNTKALMMAAEDLGLKDVITCVGTVSQKELRLLYSMASVFIYISLYEGFGLPILEAMACKVPVIASCNSSLPKDVLDAAKLVDPSNVEEIAEAMYEIISGEQLSFNMKEKGAEAIKSFSWAQTARETIKVYGKSLKKV